MTLERVVFGQVTILDLVVAAGILLAGIILAKALQIYLRRSLSERLRRDHVQLISKIVYYTTSVVSILVVLSVLGFDPSGLLVAGGSPESCSDLRARVSLQI